MKRQRKASALVLVLLIIAMFSLPLAVLIDTSTQEISKTYPRRVSQIQTEQATLGLLNYSKMKLLEWYKTDRDKLSNWNDLSVPQELKDAYSEAGIDPDGLEIFLTDMAQTKSKMFIFETAANLQNEGAGRKINAYGLQAYAKAQSKKNPDIESYAKVDFMVHLVNPLEYAIFYLNLPIEFFSKTEMNIIGDVRGNNDIYLESGHDLYFHDTLKSAGLIHVGMLIDGSNNSYLNGDILALNNDGEWISGLDQDSSDNHDPNSPLATTDWETVSDYNVDEQIDKVHFDGVDNDSAGNEPYRVIEPVKGVISPGTGRLDDDTLQFAAKAGLTLKVTGTPRSGEKRVEVDTDDSSNITHYNALNPDYTPGAFTVQAFYYDREADGSIAVDPDTGEAVKQFVKLPSGLIGDADDSMSFIENDGRVEDYEKMFFREVSLNQKAGDNNDYEDFVSQLNGNDSMTIGEDGDPIIREVAHYSYEANNGISDYVEEDVYELEERTITIPTGNVVYAQFSDQAEFRVPTDVRYELEYVEYKTRDPDEIGALGESAVIEDDQRDAGGELIYSERTFLKPSLLWFQENGIDTENAAGTFTSTTRTTVGTFQLTYDGEDNKFDLQPGEDFIRPNDGTSEEARKQRVISRLPINYDDWITRDRDNPPAEFDKEQPLFADSVVQDPNDPPPDWYDGGEGIVYGETIDTVSTFDPETGKHFYKLVDSNVHGQYDHEDYEYIVGGLLDARQDKEMDTIYLDVSELKKLVEGNSSWEDHALQGPAEDLGTYDPGSEWNGILYVEFDSDTLGEREIASHDQLGIVLINAEDLPTLGKDEYDNPVGFTFATNAPAYIVGNFNADGTPDPEDFTNYEDDEIPALIAADTVTFLSPFWAPSDDYLSQNFKFDGDTKSLLEIPYRDPSDTSVSPLGRLYDYYYDDAGNLRFASEFENTFGDSPTRGNRAFLTTHDFDSNGRRVPANGSIEISAAIISGVSIPDDLAMDTSGGVHNFFRFLEDWDINNAAVYYRGSILGLFEPEVHTAPLQRQDQMVIYRPPERYYGHNSLFNEQVPPGTPFGRTFQVHSLQMISESEYNQATTSASIASN